MSVLLLDLLYLYEEVKLGSEKLLGIHSNEQLQSQTVSPVPAFGNSSAQIVEAKHP